jgi:hypothetical protein
MSRTVARLLAQMSCPGIPAGNSDRMTSNQAVECKLAKIARRVNKESIAHLAVEDWLGFRVVRKTVGSKPFHFGTSNRNHIKGGRRDTLSLPEIDSRQFRRNGRSGQTGLRVYEAK